MGKREFRIDRDLRSFDMDKWLKTVERENRDNVKHDYNGENNLRTTSVAIANFRTPVKQKRSRGEG